ncbi:unnamed protein product, partial [marine sediment metagenome]
EVIDDFDILLRYYKEYRFNINLFPASSDDDKCPIKWPDGKNHYYFADVKGYLWPGDTWMSWQINSGLICDAPRVNCKKEYMHHAWFDIYSAEFNYLFYLSHLYYGSLWPAITLCQAKWRVGFRILFKSGEFFYIFIF